MGGALSLSLLLSCLFSITPNNYDLASARKVTPFSLRTICATPYIRKAWSRMRTAPHPPATKCTPEAGQPAVGEKKYFPGRRWHAEAEVAAWVPTGHTVQLLWPVPE
jgi:hypothetical protein